MGDKPHWLGIDHVQLAMPPGGEDAARTFYAGFLGITEVTWADDVPGVVRCHLHDPFGNRVELVDGGGGADHT